MRFPYTLFPAKPDAAFPARVSIQRPVLTLVLERGARAIATFAIVDSGADSCIFPASLAAQLGIAIPNQNASVFSGTSDSPQIAYYEPVTAKVWDQGSDSFPLAFDLYAGFCETLEHVGLGLLGQEGFFSRFSVTFNHAGQFLDIEAVPIVA